MQPSVWIHDPCIHFLSRVRFSITQAARDEEGWTTGIFHSSMTGFKASFSLSLFYVITTDLKYIRCQVEIEPL